MKYPQLVSGRTVSGIGGWLSAELESHGLDGRVYARLVLSLLHAPVEFNARDLQEIRSAFENKKQGKRTQILEEDCLWFEKKWTSEQAKRYAAVECLKSASEQKAGIESLVDELCLKLREIENEQTPEIDFQCDNSAENNVTSCDNPVELANKYYAAFPALSGINQEEKTVSFNSTISESSAWLTKSYKTPAAFTQDQPYYKRYNKTRSFRKRSKMWKETDTDRKQQNVKAVRNRAELGRKAKNKIRSTADVWDTDWELGNEELLREYINNQCDSKDEGYDTPIKCDDKDLDDVCFNQEWIYEYELNSKNSERPETVVDEINMAKFKAKFNESVEALWNDKPADTSIDELNLPVDFQDLLSSPSDTMFGNTADGPVKKPLRNSGRFMKNSIWSENFNDEENDCIINDKSFYPRANAASDEYKHQLELVRSCWENSDMETKNIKSEFNSMPWQCNYSTADITSKKWSDVISQNFLNTPYRILNHSKHLSSFSEVVPKGSGGEWPAQVIIDSFAMVRKSYNVSNYNNTIVSKEPDNPDDDLLTSPKTHFKPIKEDGYADGTTFAISSAIDTVNYKICEDGLLAIASDTQAKRYMIYKQNSSIDTLENCSKNEFIVKFCVQQISKACQTDELMFDFLRIANIGEETDNFMDSCCCCCEVQSAEKSMDGQMMKTGQIDYDIFDKEIQQFGVRKWCMKCSPTVTSHNNNNIWNSNWLPDKQLMTNDGSTNTSMNCNKSSTDPLLKIWSTDEKQCSSCGNNNLVSDIHELKSELRKDGEEILSDLSYMQSLYIGSEWDEDEQDQVIDTDNVAMESETPFDVNKLISNFIKPGDVLNLLKNAAVIQPLAKEGSSIMANCQPTKSDRKRRHSSTTRNHIEASGECKKPHCKFSHEITSMPCQLWADNSCQPDGFCPYQHNSAYARPLTR